MLFKRYVFKAIGEIFFPFFFVLFFISSIILLLNISVLTSGVKLTMSDLFWLYCYGIPNNIFFVIAITFYASCVLGLSRLSYDSEMLVFFSLGFSPRDIIKMFLPLFTMVTLTLFVFSAIILPLSKNAYRDFISYKKNTIDINIKPGDFGQKIGDWLIYVDEKVGDSYKGLVLYNQNAADSKESFIIAREGKLVNSEGILELWLYDGDSYIGDMTTLQKIHFENLIVRNSLRDSSISVSDVYGYWKPAFEGVNRTLRSLAQVVATSLFPFASIFFILFFGIKNPRFHRNFAYFYVLGSASFYFISMYIFSMHLKIACFLLPFIWFFVGMYFYNKYIKRYY